MINAQFFLPEHAQNSPSLERAGEQNKEIADNRNTIMNSLFLMVFLDALLRSKVG